MIDPAEAPGQRFDAELAALAKAREEGLIDGVGLSNVSRRQLLRAVDQTEIVCVQNLFNLGDQGSADVLAECARRGIAFVPFCPLGLPGPARSHLLTSPVLAALGARLQATPAQIALAWLLGLAPNILLIPGTRTRVHLAENLAAADVSLDDAAFAQLTRHFPAPRRARTGAHPDRRNPAATGPHRDPAMTTHPAAASSPTITPQNSAVLVLAYQPAQLATIRSMVPGAADEERRLDDQDLKTFGVPVVHSTVNVADGQGPTRRRSPTCWPTTSRSTGPRSTPGRTSSSSRPSAPPAAGS